jgi:L-phenylalanine/L-methionine N-acetyltransferase
MNNGTIRKANLNDIDFTYGLYMNPGVNSFILYEQMDKITFEPIFSALVKEGVKYIFNVDGVDVGMFKLIPLTYRCDHIVYLGGLAIDPAQSGKGFGKIMLEAIIAHTKAQHFLRLELSVAAENLKAISLYEKAGFEKEGILKKYSHLKSEGRFMDEVMMAYIYVSN